MDQAPPTGARALILNPALKPLEFLVGEWRTAGTHPEVTDQTLSGRTSFAWHEGGAFLIMRSEVDHPLFPDGVAIIGSDVSGRFAMSYFDERGVSRLFEVAVGPGTATWRRDDPEFSQSVTVTCDGSDTLVSHGRMSMKGGEWVGDLSQVFTRLGS